MTYADKLKDPRWQVRRAQILALDGNKCQYCKTDKKLNVHHTYYIKGREPWDYPNNALIVLCLNCHELAHERIKAAKYNKERINKIDSGEVPKHIAEIFIEAIKKFSYAKKIHRDK